MGKRTIVLAACVMALACGGDDPADAEIYEPCRTDADCSSRRCEEVTTGDTPAVTRRLCTTTCGGDPDCPSTIDGRGAACTRVGDSPFICLATCTGDRDCAEGFECGVDRLCQPAMDEPDGDTDAGPEALADYEPCVVDTDCDTLRCESITYEWDDRTTTDSICSRGCVDALDCAQTAAGLDGLCAAIGDSGFVCLETCAFDTDCAAGFRCGQLAGDFFACFPY